MALIDRMRLIQDDLKEKQAYIDERPQRVKNWTDQLRSLYDLIESYIAEEITAGVCYVIREDREAKSASLGTYQEPNMSLAIEKDVFFSSNPSKATTAAPDLVDFRGRAGQYTVRLSFSEQSSEVMSWAICTADSPGMAIRAQSAWMTKENFKRAIEPFFKVPDHPF